MASLKDWGQLLRLSLAPSAAADALAGVLLGAGLWPSGWAPLALVAGSLAVYHGGMALNDWSDRQEDAATRPERPIPSGRIAPKAALLLALALLLGGPLLVGLLNAQGGWALGLVSLCAVLYDTVGRGPWLGPTLLGLCRAGNMGAGMLLASGGTELSLASWAIPLAYGAYVFIVSRLGRLEDGEDAIEGRKLGPRALILCAALLLLTPALLPVAHPEPIGLAARLGALGIGLLGARGLLQAALSRSTWQPEDIIPVMGMALRRLLIFSAAVALLAGSEFGPLMLPSGVLVALVILAGYPLSHRLRRLFPPS